MGQVYFGGWVSFTSALTPSQRAHVPCVRPGDPGSPITGSFANAETFPIPALQGGFNVFVLSAILWHGMAWHAARLHDMAGGRNGVWISFIFITDCFRVRAVRCRPLS
ncbi:hypothetical protein B7R77_14540 [Ralstonia solanacearum K60]|uniref:Uncharacterized protein n=1 Tax=Ralstonia solanacearum K60 TaxID=1091042 RepID=A0AAP7ZPI7_RALSL|nr:hypothetical protein B7R77_14540 [Ralstonia solanacearum K60]